MSRQINQDLDQAKTKKSRVPIKSGSWLGNATKSLGYSAVEVLSDIMPNTINMSKSALETSQEIITGVKEFKTIQGRLSQTMENNVYMNLMREWKTNALEDLKSGNFNNTQRQQEAFEDDFDFDVGGDDDFNFDVTSEDGSTSVTSSKTSNDKQEVDVVNVHTNINSDNPMVGAIQNQTKMTVTATDASMALNKRNQLISMNMMRQLGDTMSTLLGSIDTNISTIATGTGEMLSKHIGLTATYYSDSMKLFTDIHSELQSMNSKTTLATDANNPNIKTKEYDDVLDIFSGGTVNLKAYMGLVKKQWDTASDSNLFLSSMKNMASQTDVLEMMVKNPLKFISDGIVNTFIPNLMKDSAKKFDASLGELFVSKLYQVTDLQDNSNPILDMIGRVFGINNKKVTYDKAQYEKGKVDWNGVSHRTLNDVIPFYLRKIYSSLSGTQEVAFDYNKGEYKSVNDIVKDQDKDLENRTLSPLSSMMGEFNDFLGQLKFVEAGQRDKLENDFRKLSLGLVNANGGKNFRVLKDKNGMARDDIASLLGGRTGDANIELIRGFFEGSNNSDVMKFFNSDVLAAKATRSKYITEMMKNPIEYNAQYKDLSDVAKHDQYLQYDEKTGRKVIKQKAGAPVLGVDNYKKSPTDYLRNILDTLNRGIKVAVVNNVGTGGTTVDQTTATDLYYEIINKSKTKIKALEEDNKKQKDADKEEKKRKTGKVLSLAEQNKYRNKGKVVVDTTDPSTINSSLASSVRQSQIDESNQTGNETTLSRAGILAPTSSLNKLVSKFSEYLDKPQKVISDFFGKADDFVFKLVFGEDQKGENKSLLGEAFKHMQNTFTKFAVWMDEKVISPLHESLFGDNGIITNFKNSQFALDIKSKFGEARDFLLGIKNEDGIREGGLFSRFSNELSSSMSLVKQVIIGGDAKDADGNPIKQTSPSVWDNVKSIGSQVGTTLKETFGIERDPNKPSSGNKLIDGMDDVWTAVKKRTSHFLDDVIGPANDDPNSKRNRMNAFMKETKDNLPKTMAYGTIGAGSALGFGMLGSWFLPGGPIGGAVLGAGVGLVSGSETLKKFLFGDMVDDGNGGKTRAGAIITKETQDFFKKNGMGIATGAIGGALFNPLGFLGGMFTPLGPVGGALIGGALSVATKSKAFEEFLWGTSDDQGNIIKRGILGTLKDKANGTGFSDKFMDAGIGAGVGLIGSFFLPTSPLMTAMIGSIGGLALNSEKFKGFLFGDKGEDGAREGGLFGSMKNWMITNIGNPMSKYIEQAQIKVGHFVESNMINPFMKSLAPIGKEFEKIQTRIADGFHNVITSFGDNINKTFEKFFGKPLGEFMTDNVFNPLKRVLNTIFGTIGKVVGNIAASPFKLMNSIADNLFTKHQKEGKKAFVNDNIENLFGSESRNQRREDGVRRGIFSTKDKDGNKIGKGFMGDLGNFLSIKNYKESANGEKGASYNKDNEWIEENNQRDKATEEKFRLRQLEFDNKWNPKEEKSEKQKRRWFQRKSKVDNVEVQEPVEQPKETSTVSNDTRLSENVKPAKQEPVDEVSQVQTGETKLTTGVEEEEVVTTDSTTGKKKRSRKQGKGRQRTKNKKNQTKLTQPEETPEISQNDTKEEKPSAEELVKVANDKDRTESVQAIDTKIQKASVKSTKLSQAQRDSLLKNIEGYTKVIAAEVRGQMDGLGSNIFKIRKLIQSKLGASDDDMSGSANRDRLGIWGKLKRAMRNPVDFIGDMIMAPIKGMTNFVVSGIEKAKEVIMIPFKALKSVGTLLVKGAKAVGKGILAIGKGALEVSKSLLKIPAYLAGSMYEVIKAVGPVVSQAAVQGIKFIGTSLTQGVKLIGKTLYSAVSTVGGVLTGAAKGFGKALGATIQTIGSVTKAGIFLLKDALVAGGQLLINAAATIGNGLLNVVKLPFKLIGGMFGKAKDLVGKNSLTVQKVSVVGGILDKVKLIEKVKKPEDKMPEPPVPHRTDFRQPEFTDSRTQKDNATKPTPISSTPSDSSVISLHDRRKVLDEPKAKQVETRLATDDIDGKIGNENVSSATDSTHTALTIHAEERDKIAKEEKQKEAAEESRSQVASKDYDYFKNLDTAQDAALAKEKKEASLFSSLTNLVNINKEHSTNWASIFGKKGLITGALLLGIPLLSNFIKNFKFSNLINVTIPNIASSIVDGIKEAFDWLLHGAPEDSRKDPETGEDIADPARTYSVVRTGTKVGKAIVKKSADASSTIAKTTTKLAKGASSLVDSAYVGVKSLTDNTFSSTLRQRAGAYETFGEMTAKQAKSEAAKTLRSEATTSITTKVKSTATDITNKVASESSKLVDKFVTIATKALDTFLENKTVQKILSTKGVSGAKSLISKFIKNDLTEALVKNASKYSKKILRVASDVAYAFPPLGIALDVIFLACDSISGFADAASIFKVSKDNVTFGMRVAASLSKALLGWVCCGVFDLISEITRAYFGPDYDFRKIIAEIIYDAGTSVGSFFGVAEDSSMENLRAKQNEYQAEYDSYVTTQKEKGENYLSQDAWIDKDQQSGLSKAWDKTKQVTSNAWDKTKEITSNGWNATKDWASNAWGNTKEFASNVWDNSIFNIGSTTRKTLGINDDKDITLSQTLSAYTGKLMGVFGGESEDHALAVYQLVTDLQSGAKQWWTETKDTWSKNWQITKDSFGEMCEAMNTGIGSWLGFVDDDGKALSMTKGISYTYTKTIEGIGKTVTDIRTSASNWWTETKDTWSKNWQITKDSFGEMTTVMNQQIGGWLGFHDDDGNPISVTQGTKALYNKTATGISLITKSIGIMASEWWTKTKKTMSDAWTETTTKLKNLPGQIDKVIGGWFGLSDDEGNKLGLFEWAGQKVKNTTSGISNWWQELTNRGKETINDYNNGGYGDVKPTRKLGGYGGDKSFTYYSQNDPRYANTKYETSQGHDNLGIPETISKRGCGPTALAMVASELTGMDANPTLMSSIATNQGYSTEGGTDPSYFGNVGSQFGLGVEERQTSKTALKESLSTNKPVILQGQSNGEENSPFTPYGHYVVATKTAGDKVIINDPRGEAYSKAYDLDQVVNQSAMMWSYGRDNNNVSNADTRLDLSNIKGLGDSTTVAEAMIKVARAQVGKPYIMGAEGKDYGDDTRDAFDCSGLISYALDRAGVTSYGRLNAALFRNKATKISASDLQPGDLGFIRNSDGDTTHVGLWSDNNTWIEAMGDDYGVVEVPTSRASKWTDYGRLKEVNNATTLSESYDNNTTIENTVASSSTGSTSTSFVSGLVNLVSDEVNKFLGIKTTSSDDSTGSSSSTSINYENSSITEAPTSLRDAVNKKTFEMLIKNEGGGDYAIAQNDVSSSSGKSISPSIGVLQWRGEYADALMSKIREALPNDSDAKYFDSINWKTEANKGGWSDSKLTRYRNFMTKNLSTVTDVQNKYALQYIDDRLTGKFLYPNFVNKGLIKDPRSMVLINDISQTGPGHSTTFAGNYNSTVPSGKTELDHFYSQLASSKSYWGKEPQYSKYYKNRLKRTKDTLASWNPITPGYSGYGDAEPKTESKFAKVFNKTKSLFGKKDTKCKDTNNTTLEKGGFGDLSNLSKPAKQTTEKVAYKPTEKKPVKVVQRVEKDYTPQANTTNTSNVVKSLAGFGGTTDNNKVIELLSTMVEYLKGTKDGIDTFNSKEFIVNSPNTVNQYIDGSTTAISNGSTNVTNNSTTQQRSSSKSIDNKTNDSAYKLAKSIAGGLLV